MERSPEISDLITALAKSQAEFGIASKDSDNPYYGSKYADLASVIGAVRPALSKNGIAFVQLLESDLERQTATVTTSLHHGEQFIAISAEAPAIGKGKNGEPKFDVQSIGSAWTYLKRYTLQSICGIPSEDDDGNSLQGNNPPVQAKSAISHNPPQAPAPRPTTQTPTQTPQARVEAAKAQQQAEQGHFAVYEDRVECIIKGVVTKETKAKKPYMNVTWNGFMEGFTYATNWHESLATALHEAVGKPVVLKVAKKMSDDGKSIKFLNIEDVFSVDGVQYKKGQPDVLLTQLTKSVEAVDNDIPF